MMGLACGLLLGCKISQMLDILIIELELCFGSTNSSMSNLKLPWLFFFFFPLLSSSKTSHDVAGEK